MKRTWITKKFSILAAIMVFMLLFSAPVWATALSADKAMDYTGGKLLVLPVDDGDTIYAGALISVNAAGYVIAGADTASTIFVGIAQEYVDNSAGLDGDDTVVVQRQGVFKMLLGTAITVANVGDNVFIEDDATVDLTANVTHNIYVGIIAKYIDTTHAWVDITPAIQQADVATHIADSSAAHAASAVSIADAGFFTAQTEAEATIQEIFQHLFSTQKFIPLPLTIFRESSAFDVGAIAANGGVLASDTTPILEAINAATDGCQRIDWANTNNDQIVVQVPLPPDIDITKDLVLHIRIASASTTDAVGFTVDTFFNEADSKVTDTTTTNQTATYGEKIATIAAADVPEGAQTITIGLTPVAHTTDAMYLTGAWLEYTPALLTE